MKCPLGLFLLWVSNVLGQAYNQVILDHDPSAHAEIIAFREAAQAIEIIALNQAILYVTLEPCAMCAGAMVHARIARLVFAARDFKAGAAGSAYNLLQGHPLNHHVQIDEGILEKECAQLLKNFFKTRR